MYALQKIEVITLKEPLYVSYISVKAEGMYSFVIQLILKNNFLAGSNLLSTPYIAEILISN